MNLRSLMIAAFAAGLAVSVPGLASAQTMQPYPMQWAPRPRPAWVGLGAILRADNQVSASFVDTHMRYDEYNDPSRSGGSYGIIDSENGWLPGARVSLTTVGPALGVRYLYFNARGTWLNGTTTYWGGGADYITHDIIKSGMVRIGVMAPLGYGMALTGYVGAGKRQWNRDLLGAGGYREVYSDGYAGGGLRLQSAAGPRVVYTLDTFFGSMFDTHMVSSLTPGGYAITPDHYQIGGRFVVIVNASMDYALTRRLHLRIATEYTRFQFGESPLAPDLTYEPKSTTSTVTAEVGLGYGF